jgi:hypothetical protein
MMVKRYSKVRNRYEQQDEMRDESGGEVYDETFVLASDYEALEARVKELEAVLWDIREFTNGYGDVAGIVHRKARDAIGAKPQSEHSV